MAATVPLDSQVDSFSSVSFSALALGGLLESRRYSLGFFSSTVRCHVTSGHNYVWRTANERGKKTHTHLHTHFLARLSFLFGVGVVVVWNCVTICATRAHSTVSQQYEWKSGERASSASLEERRKRSPMLKRIEPP